MPSPTASGTGYAKAHTLGLASFVVGAGLLVPLSVGTTFHLYVLSQFDRSNGPTISLSMAWCYGILLCYLGYLWAVTYLPTERQSNIVTIVSSSPTYIFDRAEFGLDAHPIAPGKSSAGQPLRDPYDITLPICASLPSRGHYGVYARHAYDALAYWAGHGDCGAQRGAIRQSIRAQYPLSDTGPLPGSANAQDTLKLGSWGVGA